MNAARACKPYGHHGVEPDLSLQAQVVDVDIRILDVEFNRANRIAYAALKRRVRKRRIVDDDARCGRRIGYRNDEILLIVGVEIDSVTTAQTGSAITEEVPRKAQTRRDIFQRRVFIELADGRLSVAQIDECRVAPVNIYRQCRRFVAQADVQIET